MKLVFIALVGLLASSSVFAHAKSADRGLVDGIGGVFIYCKDTATLAKWYSEKLGIQFVSDPSDGHYYVIFPQVDQNFTVFALFPAAEPSTARNAFILNLRLKDYDATLKRLRESGVVIQKEEDYEYGRFAWFSDGEGNQIEVWQPK